MHVALLSMTSYFMLSSRRLGCYTYTWHPTSSSCSHNFLLIPSETLQSINNNLFTLSRHPSNLDHPASLMSGLQLRSSHFICEKNKIYSANQHSLLTHNRITHIYRMFRNHRIYSLSVMLMYFIYSYRFRDLFSFDLVHIRSNGFRYTLW